MDKNKIIEGAAKLVAKGAYDKAIKEYQKVLDADPKDVRVLQKMGELYQKKNDNGQAAHYFTKVAESYAGDGFFLKAVALYKQVQKLDPDLFEVNVKLGELHQQLGLLSEATAYFQLVANHYDKQGNTKASLDTLKKMVDLDPDNIASRRKLAELYAREGMNKEAATEFKRVADYCQKNNRQDDYLAVAERIAALEPENVQLARDLAHSYLAKGDQKRALAKLQVCFKADPRDLSTLTLLAEAFTGLGQTSKTVSVYKEIAKLHGEAGRQAESNGFWDRIADLDPTDPDLAARSRPAGAPARPPASAAAYSTAAAEPATRTGPAPAAAPPPISAPQPMRRDQLAKLLTETDVYMKYGLHDKALEHLRRVFAVEPENLDAHEKAYHIYVGAKQGAQASEQLLNVLRLCTRRSDVERAQSYLDTLLKENPHHPEMPAFLAVLRPEGGVEGDGDDEAILVDSVEEEIVVSDAPEDALAEQASMGVGTGALGDDGEELVSEDEAGVEIASFADEPFNPESTVQVDAAYAREAYARQPSLEEDEVVVEEAELEDSVDAEDMEVTSADAEALALAAEDPAEEEVVTTDEDSMLGSASDFDEPGSTFDKSTVTDIGAGAGEEGSAEPETSADWDAPEVTHPAGTQVHDLGSEDAEPELSSEPADDWSAEAPLEEEPVVSSEPSHDDWSAEEPVVETTSEPSHDDGSTEAPVGEAPPEPEAAPEAEPEEIVSDDDFVSADEESVEAPPEEDADDPVAAECEEASFFIDQGLLEEAREILETVMIARPGHARAEELLGKIATLEASGVTDNETHADHTPEASDAPPTVAAVEEGGGERDAFDLAAELADELGEAAEEVAAAPSSSGDDFQYSVEEVFTEFKRGLAKVVKPEDVDTHYDLGIAYKEMGLIDDAIGEFTVAREGCMGKKKEVDCLTMTALLQGMKADFTGAVQSLKLALQTEHAVGDLQKALTYELAQAQESAGEPGKALFHFLKVQETDATYRDVAAMVERLSAEATPEEDPVVQPTPIKKRNEPPPSAPAKARKVGYL